MISSSNAPITGSKYSHVHYHDVCSDEIEPGQNAHDAARRTFYLGEESHDIGKPVGQNAHDAAQRDEHQDVHKVRVEEMCIGEVTEEDMMHKLFECEEHGHGKDSGGFCFLERGTGVCLGATVRNGSSEIRDREDPRV